MDAIFGIAISLAAAAAFYYSLPRDGKVARFVGTEWEGYTVVAMIGMFGIGAIFAISGLVQAMK